MFSSAKTWQTKRKYSRRHLFFGSVDLFHWHLESRWSVVEVLLGGFLSQGWLYWETVRSVHRDTRFLCCEQEKVGIERRQSSREICRDAHGRSKTLLPTPKFDILILVFLITIFIVNRILISIFNLISFLKSLGPLIFALIIRMKSFIYANWT